MAVPEKPALASFETLFTDTPQILERATGYWESGRVGPVRQIAPQLYHAQVTGASDDHYDVDIRLSATDAGSTTDTGSTAAEAGDTTDAAETGESARQSRGSIIRIQSAACTCPYQSTPYCKHIGAVLFELRRQLVAAESHRDDDADGPAIAHTVLAPIQQALAKRLDQGDGHLLFMWSTVLRDTAKTMLSAPNAEQPLLAESQAQELIFTAIRDYGEYRQNLDGDAGHDGDDPDQAAHMDDSGDGRGPGTTYRDDAPYQQFIDAILTVADNALQSRDFANACSNLRLCVHSITTFIHGIDVDPMPLLGLMDRLVMRIRCFMENVAEFADSTDAGKALSTIEQAAYDDDLRRCDPLNSMLLISCALAFARYDDKRMWAYDVIDNALVRNLGDSDYDPDDPDYPYDHDCPYGPDYDDEEDDDHFGCPDCEFAMPPQSARILRMFTLMAAYDLFALSDDGARRRQLLDAHPSSSPLTLMDVAVMICENRFRSAYMTASRFLAMSADARDADLDISRNGLLPDLLPHGWHTIMECCAEGLADVAMLAGVYRHYIITCDDKTDVHYVADLRALMRRHGGISTEEWHETARMLAWDCARDIIVRIKRRSETIAGITLGRTGQSILRNPAYEQIIIDERLSDEAMVCCTAIDYPPLPLLHVLAINHPDAAWMIILDALPAGAVEPSTVMKALGLAAGAAFRIDRGNGWHDGRGGSARLESRRGIYRQIAAQLRRAAAVFGDDATRVVARGIVSRYPNRPALREELAFAL